MGDHMKITEEQQLEASLEPRGVDTTDKLEKQVRDLSDQLRTALFQRNEAQAEATQLEKMNEEQSQTILALEATIARLEGNAKA